MCSVEFQTVEEVCNEAFDHVMECITEFPLSYEVQTALLAGYANALAFLPKRFQIHSVAILRDIYEHHPRGMELSVFVEECITGRKNPQMSLTEVMHHAET